MANELKLEKLDELRDWLRNYPDDWARTIACRSALRVLPLVGAEIDSDDSPQSERSKFVLSCFRANFVTWAAQKYPSAAMALARPAAAHAAIVTLKASVITRAADASLQAIAFAANANTESASDAAAHATYYAASAATAPAQIWAAATKDAQWLGANPEERLINQPLWLEDVREDVQYKANIPPWVRSAFDRFVNSDSAKQQGFNLWIAWYRGVIPNVAVAGSRDYFGRDLTLRISRQPDAWWDRPVSKVNADIWEWFHGLWSDPEYDRDLRTALENLPSQTPAAYRFLWQDDRIKAEPPDPSPGDSAVAQDLLDETRRKAEVLSERLERSNADPHVHHSVDGLLDVLPAAVGSLRPGLLLSRARSIEAIAVAYANSDDAQELFPEVVAQVLDLSETVRDLQGCLPEIREIEAERLALEIDPRNVDEIGHHLDTIVEAAVADEEVVDESAKDALRAMATDTDEGAPPHIRQRLLADRALVVRNFLSPLFRWAAASRFASEVTEVARETLAKARPKFIDGAAEGLGAMGRPVAVVGVSALVGLFLGPTAFIAAMLAGFGRLDQLGKLLERWSQNDRPSAVAEQDDDASLSE